MIFFRTSFSTASATTTANQIPFTPQIAGNIIIVITCITKVLRKDKIADTFPSFNAVKNDDVNILNPVKRYDNAYILIALVVNSINSAL